MERRTFLNKTAKLTALSMVGVNSLTNSVAASTEDRYLLNSKNSTAMGPIPDYQNVTTVVKLKGKEVKVHALCTGTVAVKRNFRTKKGVGELAKLNILLDKHYTDYLPIWVWVIEHPEGIVVIDTGEISAIKDLDRYLAKEGGFLRYQFKHAAKFRMEEKEELNYRFDEINLKLEDVRLVALTHLDHTDGLKFFPKQEIIVGDYEYNHPNANMSSTYPSWFRPNKVNYLPDRIEVFQKAYPITSSEDLLYIPTPGHTLGHSSIVFKTDNFDIIFAGDTSYNQAQVLHGELAGVNADYTKSKETYNNLVKYATNRKTIYLPTHDEDAGNRLKNSLFLV
ncbi:N-acyl homoserine lactonase family protein [Runella sp.]|uniref:N-acyl homoserine lactonase family protein n=1 Tax=Runella sp. TaxID=1960881 RepID=UPI00262295BA|nr:N-acyl homoserine lactonase family protein [Runella sp.]